MFIAPHVVQFVRQLHVGHAEYVESGDAENGPQMHKEFVRDEFGIYCDDRDHVIVVNQDGRFLAQFEVADIVDAMIPTPVFIAPNVDVETTRDENPWDDSPATFIVDNGSAGAK